MDMFLVIAGSLIIILGLVTFVLFKTNNNLKVGKVPLKYVLLVSSISVLILTIAILKMVYGKNVQKLDELLLKLKKTKADGEINVINEKINNNNDKVEEINKEIDYLKKDYDSNKLVIQDLEKQKQIVSDQIKELDLQKKSCSEEKDSLENKVEKMKELLKGE